MSHTRMAGIYAAALTPLKPDYSPDLAAIPVFLSFLAGRGCHGALLLGTTGEGPSFNREQRLDIYRAGLEVRQVYPQFRLLAGTGTPSLGETIWLNRRVFDLGLDGVVVLPPYYFRKVSESGLFAWFKEVIQQSIPHDGSLLGYHIPAVSGVPLSLELLNRLKDSFPDQFAGLKDSSADPAYAEQLGDHFGKDLSVLTGADQLLSLALQSGASGCITAPANLISPDLRRIFDAHQSGRSEPELQARVNRIRKTLEQYPPYPPLLKALLSRNHGFPRWPVCPPLLPLSKEIEEKADSELHSLA